MELVQTLLTATTAVVSPDLLDKIVKVSLEKNWGIGLESELKQPKHVSKASGTFNSKTGHKITIKPGC